MDYQLLSSTRCNKNKFHELKEYQKGFRTIKKGKGLKLKKETMLTLEKNFRKNYVFHVSTFLIFFKESPGGLGFKRS